MPVNNKYEAIEYVNSWSDEPDARAGAFFAGLLDGLSRRMEEAKQPGFSPGQRADLREAYDVVMEAYYGATGKTYIPAGARTS